MKITSAGAATLPLWLGLCAPSWAASIKGDVAVTNSALPGAAAGATAAGDPSTPLVMPEDVGQALSGLTQSDVVETVQAEQAHARPAAAQAEDFPNTVRPAEHTDVAGGHTAHHLSPLDQPNRGAGEEGAEGKDGPPVLGQLVKTEQALGHLDSGSAGSPIPAMGKLDQTYSGAEVTALTAELVTTALRSVAARVQPVVNTVYEFDPGKPKGFTLCGSACVGLQRHVQESLRAIFPGSGIEVRPVVGNWGPVTGIEDAEYRYRTHMLLKVFPKGSGLMLGDPLAFYDPTAAQWPELVQELGSTPGEPIILPWSVLRTSYHFVPWENLAAAAEEIANAERATRRGKELDRILGPGVGQ